MKKYILYSSITLIFLSVTLYFFYSLLYVGYEKRTLNEEVLSLKEKMLELKDKKLKNQERVLKEIITEKIIGSQLDESNIIISSYEPVSKDFPLQTTPLAVNFCDSEKIFKIETINTQDELKTFNIKMNSWKDLFVDFSDEIIILNLIELTLLHEKISKKN